jgi:hypothetical protein
VGSGDDAGSDSAGGGGGLLTLDYIRRKGVQSLVKDLAIAVTPHPDLPALLHLAPDPTTSPADHPIVRECAYSLLIEECEASVIDGLQPRRDWRVVAMGYTKIDHLIDPFTLVIDFPRTKDSAFNADAGASTGGGGAGGRQRGFCWDKSEMRVLEKLDGKMALLYHYAGAWRVVSAVTPDASEPVVEELSLSKRCVTLRIDGEECALANVRVVSCHVCVVQNVQGLADVDHSARRSRGAGQAHAPDRGGAPPAAARIERTRRRRRQCRCHLVRPTLLECVECAGLRPAGRVAR